jgi:hypothetical protein
LAPVPEAASALRIIVGDTEETNDGVNSPEHQGVTIKLEVEKLREVRGRLPVYRSGIPCVIVGEMWPAWLPVVPALGAKVSVILCDGEAADWDVEQLSLDAARLGVHSMEGGALFVRESLRDTPFFVSGSARFLLKWADVFKDKCCVVVAFDSGSRVSTGMARALPDLCWKNVRQADFGGVTACWNWMGSSTALKLVVMEGVPYRRSIREILKPTLQG